MVIKLSVLKLFKYKYESFKFQRFYKKCNLNDDTFNESERQRFYNYPIYPRVSKI